jgi:hypothetical protein
MLCRRPDCNGIGWVGTTPDMQVPDALVGSTTEETNPNDNDRQKDPQGNFRLGG